MLLLDVKVIPIYVSIMILITLDRFFTFFLNLKYDQYWLKTESRIFLVFLYTVALLIFTPALICALESIFYDGNTFKHIIATLLTYFNPIFQEFFVIIAVFTYSFIFTKHKKSVRLRLSRNATNMKPHNQLKTIIPTLIILSCFFFAIIPSISYSFYCLLYHQHKFQMALYLFSLRLGSYPASKITL